MTTFERSAGLRLVKSLLVALVISAVALTSLPPRADASLLGGALVGGGMGALFGGIIGGRGGAVAGALIGGTIGAVKGDRRAKSRARYSARAGHARRAAGTASQSASSAGYTLVVETQKALVTHGFDPGKIDGVAGSGTRSAIEAYQKKNGLLVTGQASDALLKHMLQKKG